MTGPADESGRLITVFRSYRRPGSQDLYEETAVATEAAARSMPGFVEMKTFTAGDGEHVTIAVFEDGDSQAAWKALPLHREAQEKGRSTFYKSYDLTVAEIRFRRRWSKDDLPSA